MTEKVVWHIVRQYAAAAGISPLAPVSRGWRRTGADPVCARARVNPDNRTVSRLQAADTIGSQRPDWHRADPLMDRPAGYLTDCQPSTRNGFEPTQPSRIQVRSS